MTLMWIILIIKISVCMGDMLEPPDDLYKQFPRDNSLYKPNVNGTGSRYIWMPKNDMQLTLVDLKDDLTKSSMNTRPTIWNKYYLYTNQNRQSPVEILYGDHSVALSSGYNPLHPTVVLVHDWHSNASSYPMIIIRDALTANECNVIVLNWEVAASKTYSHVVWAVPEIGKHIGDFVKWLYEDVKGRWSKTHFIGFGIGAHIVGNAGRSLGGQPARITGLDPSGPLFENNNDGLRRHDAGHVEVFHTDFNTLGSTGLRGHLDFFPNGGMNQPLCVGEKKHICSHLKACEYFAATVNGGKIMAKECKGLKDALSEDCAGRELIMGTNNFPKRGSGIFGAEVEFRLPY